MYVAHTNLEAICSIAVHCNATKVGRNFEFHLSISCRQSYRLLGDKSKSDVVDIDQTL